MHLYGENVEAWDTDLNKSDDFLLDPFCIYNIYAMFWFVFSVKNYTNKILFKLNVEVIFSKCI